MRVGDVARARLAALQITGSSARTPLDAVRNALALQGQDLPGAKWSIGLRVPGCTISQVHDAFSSREIVRSWPMRGTLHVVAAEDLAWMLSLTSARTLALAAPRQRQLQLDAQILSKARAVARAALEGDRELGRSAFLSELERNGISTSGQRGYHIIWHLAQVGVLCWGPIVDGSHQGLVLLDEWVPNPRKPERDEALREFVIRYLAAHGPATIEDFVWWSSLTMADARAGWALAREELEATEVGDRRLWMLRSASDAASAPSRSRCVHALPGFDEYILGYKDRSVPIPHEYAQLVVPGNNGVFMPTIVANGRAVGTWRRRAGSRWIIEPHPFSRLPVGAESGFRAAISRYGRFLGRDVVVAATAG